MKGTPFDFNQPTAIGLRIGEDDEQLKLAKGYDHNWVLDKGKTRRPAHWFWRPRPMTPKAGGCWKC